jgi:hypothetical protein
MARRRVLCITGMHRSGTSLTASWLQGCGLVIDNGRLLGPATGNERGHYEDLDIVDFQREAITAQVRESNGWKVHEGRPLHFSWRTRARLAVAVSRRMIKYPTWGFKDPRSALFLNDWRRLVPGIRTLIVWRPASDVAMSLERRASKAATNPKPNRKLSVASGEGLVIWRAYNRLLLDYARQHERTTIVTSLAALIANDRAVFERVNTLLDDRLSYAPLSSYAQDEMLHSDAGPADPMERELTAISWDA